MAKEDEKQDTVKPKQNSNNNQNNGTGPKRKTKKAKVRVFEKKVKGDSERNIINNLKAKYESINIETIKTFRDLPLSGPTQKGLKECGYTVPTEIQLHTIGLSLRGEDVLGAAKTGSGKTLAFLIPILELLYCKQWTRLDGLGALVITPTRELAYQIFETLRKIGQYHDFSAGLIIGGKDLKFERKRMDKVNIIIGTPGRLLQHMDENPLFDCVNLQILVLDEADRCLDLGFKVTLDGIIENLPVERQTLLFSATQTKSVKDLARLSLKDPKYISAHENSKHATPEGLKQVYSVCELHEKISVLYTFIKTHLKQKIIIFLASCKQVKYVYEAFCRLRPGMSLLALYGSLHQLRRMDIYEQFCRKQSAVLFATDLAARGLDFPAVNWVVQADCPEDAATYIHRVGRTARYQSGGQSLLLLMPSEKDSMLKQLEDAKIPITEVPINMERLQNPVRKLDAFLARDVTLKETAQRAFVAYAKAVFLMKDKSVFDIRALDTESFARSLGLAVTPRIRFLQRADKRNQITDNSNKSNKENTITKFDQEENQENENTYSSENESEDEGVVDKNNRVEKQVSDDSDDDFLSIKRKNHDIEDISDVEELEDLNLNKEKSKKPITKAALAKKMMKKKILPNKKIVFNEEGEAQFDYKTKQSEIAREYENENEGGIDIDKVKLILREEDKFDKQRFRQKVKEKHREERRKLKEARLQEQQQQDDFGESDDGDEGPDLSWLPDPDKIFGPKKSDNFSPDNFENPKNNKPNKKLPPSKMSKLKRKSSNKLSDIQKSPNSKKKKKNVDIGGLSVNETEELALMLLKNK